MACGAFVASFGCPTSSSCSVLPLTAALDSDVRLLRAARPPFFEPFVVAPIDLDQLAGIHGDAAAAVDGGDAPFWRSRGAGSQRVS
jgi:hypothetical protein